MAGITGGLPMRPSPTHQQPPHPHSHLSSYGNGGHQMMMMDPSAMGSMGMPNGPTMGVSSGVGGLGVPQRGIVGQSELAMGKVRGQREGKESRSRPYNKMRCPHNRDHYSCRECGGAGICIHKKRKSQCRDCGGKSVCEHNKVRSYCRDCGGGGLCHHNRVRSKCKDCGGSGICKHGRHKNLCRDCGGSGICEHKHQKNKCRKCIKINTCGHKVSRKSCLECKTMRDTGPEELAARVHELLAALEDAEVLDAHHPAALQIQDKIESVRVMALAYVSAPMQELHAQVGKQKILQQHRKRKKDEMHLGAYAHHQNMAGMSHEQYQQMAANYYHHLQLHMQQSMPGKPGKLMKYSPEINRSTADRVDAINKLYLQGQKEIKALLEEGVLLQEEFEIEKQRLYKKKEDSLAKQRLDEAALYGAQPLDSVGAVHSRGAMNDPYQQALQMHYYYQQQHPDQQGKANEKLGDQGEEEEDDANDEEDMNTDEPGACMPRDRVLEKEGEPFMQNAAAAESAGGAQSNGRVLGGEERKGVLPNPIPYIPIPFWSGMGPAFPPFSPFYFPGYMQPSRKSATSKGWSADDGTPAKKRGRPRKIPLPVPPSDTSRPQQEVSASPTLSGLAPAETLGAVAEKVPGGEATLGGGGGAPHRFEVAVASNTPGVVAPPSAVSFRPVLASQPPPPPT